MATSITHAGALVIDRLLTYQIFPDLNPFHIKIVSNSSIEDQKKPST
jgi:hypothetical protein